jgi:hypothetical protein
MNIDFISIFMIKYCVLLDSNIYESCYSMENDRKFTKFLTPYNYRVLDFEQKSKHEQSISPCFKALIMLFSKSIFLYWNLN